MKHLKYEFESPEDMMAKGSDWITMVDGQPKFTGGYIVQLGYKYNTTYDENGDVISSEKISGWLVDILWTIPNEQVPKHLNEVYPTTPDHFFAGLENLWLQQND